MTRLRDVGSAGANGKKVDPQRVRSRRAIWHNVNRSIGSQERCDVWIHHIINRESKRLPVDSIKAPDNYAAVIVLAEENPSHYLTTIHWNAPFPAAAVFYCAPNPVNVGDLTELSITSLSVGYIFV